MNRLHFTLGSIPLLSVGLGFSLLFIGLYQRDINLDRVVGGSGRQIGQVVETLADVSRRPRARLLWIPTQSHVAVFEKDTLKTGANSYAKIQLGSNSYVELKPDSLAVLETQSDGIKINLASGDLFIKGNILAQVGKTKIVSEGSQGGVRIQKDPKSETLKIATQGQAKAKITTASGIEKSITEGLVIEQKGSGETLKIEKFDWQFSKGLEQSAKIYNWNEPLKIEFQIESLSQKDTPRVSNPEIQIFGKNSKTKSSKVPLASFSVSPSESTLPITHTFEKPGSYILKILDPVTQKEVGESREILISQTPPPKSGVNPAKFPPQNLKFEFIKSKPDQVSISGASPEPDVQRVEIVVGKTSHFIEAKDFSPTGNWLITIPTENLENLTPPKIYVKNIYSFAQTSPTVDLNFDPTPLSFRKALRSSPRLISPSIDRNFSEVALKTSPIVLRWSNPTAAPFAPIKYRITLAKEDAPALPIFQLESRETTVEIEKPLPGGSYVWNVQAQWDENLWGETSKSRKFRILPASKRSPSSFEKPTFVFEGAEE